MFEVSNFQVVLDVRVLGFEMFRVLAFLGLCCLGV